ncbi:MAG: phosphate signaling complex protein PhoU [Chloroflexi bacterium]|nr:phosphate signaling complex protein PhoU [Chloroflexota bacterium]
MARESFARQLRGLQDEVIVLGSMVEKAIARSVEALQKRDFELADLVVKNDEKINQKRFQIEEECVMLITKQQPMASDLRVILSVLSVITDLERMGDYASGIAEITLILQHDPPLEPPAEFPRMAEIGIQMLSDSLKAFVARDAEAAYRIGVRDDEIDALYHKVMQQCLAYITEDPRTAATATRLIWVGHNLERIGDRVTNICERVIFTVTGKMEEIWGTHPSAEASR